VIFHILTKGEWDAARRRGTYAPATLPSEGFIHCSTLEQTAATANAFFRGQTDLVLLCIEESRVASPIRRERPAAAADNRGGEFFPHIHGPLNLDSVVRATDYPCERDGSFRPPRV